MADIVVNKIDMVIHDRAQGLTGAKGDKGDAGEGIDAGLLAALQGAESASAENVFVTQALFDDIKDPTGFISPASIVVTGRLDRTITLTGPLDYRWRGTAKELTAPWTSDAHPAGDGPHFLYSSDGDTFAWSSTVWPFDTIHVCRHYKGIYYRECHGTMPWQTHQNLHHHPNHGALRFSGGDVLAGSYALDTDGNAAVTPDFVEAVILDEDLPSTVPALAAGAYCHLYFSGLQVPEMATAQALPYRVGATYPLINGVSAGTFTDAEIATTAVQSTKRWFNVYQILAPVAADVASQAARMMFLQPQTAFSSLAAAQAESFSSLNVIGLGGFSPELVGYTRLTFETGSTFTATGKVRLAATATISGKLNVSGTGTAATTAENVTTTPFDDIVATNQQATNEELGAKRVKITGSNRQLTAATGDEVAYTLDYTVNKATSGNDTGLLIKMTDTASPGVSYPLDIQVGGSRKVSVDQNGSVGIRTTPAINPLTISGSNATNIECINFTQVGAGTGLLKAAWSSGGTLGIGDIVNRTIVSSTNRGGIGFHAYGVVNAGSSGLFRFNCDNNAASAAPLLVVSGAQTQQYNLQEWCNSTASILAYVSPTGTFKSSGIIQPSRLVTDADATMLATDYTLRMSTGASNRTVDLLAAVDGQIIHVKKIDSGVGNVSFIATGLTCTIDGLTTRLLNAQYESLCLQCVSKNATDIAFDIL